MTEYEKLLTNPAKPKDNFKLSIKYINETGFTKVSFSEEIIPSVNVNALNNPEEQVLKVKFWSANLQDYDEAAIEEW